MEIKAQYKHSKAGTVMFNACAKWTKFLLKNKWLYYLLACTWGILTTIIGLLVTAVLFVIKGFKKNTNFYKYDWIYGIKTGPDYWGGFEMGLMFVRDQKSSQGYIDAHEFGHTFQNCLLGPLFIFLVAIPSVIRYWIQEFRGKAGKQNPPYDAIWFEDSARQCGLYADWYIKHKK